MNTVELLNISEVANLLRISVPTVRERLYQRRRGIGIFPQPISGIKQKQFWLRREIVTYIERINAEQNPLPQGAPRTQRVSTATRETLQKFGLDVPDGGEVPTVGERILQSQKKLKRAGVEV